MATSTKPITPEPAAMLGRLGSHLAMSLGIALALAGAASLPRVLDGGPAGAGIQPVANASPETLATISGGKIVDRLSLAAGEGRPAEQPFTPAALAMPMMVAWAEPMAVGVQSTAPVKLRTAAVEMVPVPPRRDIDLADAGRADRAPLQIMPAVQVAGPEIPAADAGWRRIVAAPAIKVADVASGTAEVAQAAGAWTLSRATSLLPRW